MRFTVRDLRPAPDVFAAVMATGILSIGARRLGYAGLSDALGVLASAGLVVLLAVVVVAAVAERGRLWQLDEPDVTLGLFTFVAACAVLDSRLEHHRIGVWVLGVAAFAAWLVLTLLTIRNMTARSWSALRDEARGGWLLASVGTSGLVIIEAQLVRATGQRAWLTIAVPLWLIALAVYALMATLILWRTVQERKDPDGFVPDTWILMGAMAIATLAGDSLGALLTGAPGTLVRLGTVITWVLATGWIPPLIYFVLHRVHQRPALLQFDGVWWAVVFPLGMYAVASHAMSAELAKPALETVALVFFWNALAAWLIVAAAGLRRVRTLGAAQPAG